MKPTRVHPPARAHPPLSPPSPPPATPQLMCDACGSALDRAVADDGMHWFVAHCDPTFVQWCSHPKLLRPSVLPKSVRPAALSAALRRKDPAAVAAAVALAAGYIERAAHVLLVVGAGMGVDAGLPTFRGKDGFYSFGAPSAAKAAGVGDDERGVEGEGEGKAEGKRDTEAMATATVTQEKQVRIGCVRWVKPG